MISRDIGSKGFNLNDAKWKDEPMCFGETSFTISQRGKFLATLSVILGFENIKYPMGNEFDPKLLNNYFNSNPENIIKF